MHFLPFLFHFKAGTGLVPGSDRVFFLREFLIYILSPTVLSGTLVILNPYTLLPCVSVADNAGSGLDERVYFLLIHTTSNYT
jgi:hypothetical protein